MDSTASPKVKIAEGGVGRAPWLAALWG